MAAKRKVANFFDIILLPSSFFQICVNDSIGGPPLYCDSSKNLASLSEIG
jgi:hypothetical protein